MIYWSVALVAITGCVETGSVTCDDGRVCPDGHVCKTLHEGREPACVPVDQAVACDGIDTGMPCNFAADRDEVCFEGVCTIAGCGNRYVEADEVCDDGNDFVGDGCAANCRSDETCGNAIIDPVKGEECDDDALARNGCTACRTESERWDRLPFQPRPAVDGAALAYDVARQRVVAFGGAYAAGVIVTPPSDQTWELDADVFGQRSVTVRPSRRYGAAMAYDAARRRTVLFGGFVASTTASDTWEWDGNRWTRIDPPARPGPRARAGMVYDAHRKRIVLTGGFVIDGDASTAYDDAWTYDGGTWTQMATAPSGRGDHAIAYDPKRDRVVVLGGLDGSGGASKDIWELDGDTWAPTTVTTPNLIGAVMAYDPMTEREIIFDLSGATTSWNGTALVPLAPSTAPPRRKHAAMATDPDRKRIVMYGGQSACQICPKLSDVWTWDGATWREIVESPAQPPTRRESPALAFDALRGETIVFGGNDGLSALDDTWKLVGETWIELHPTTHPPARTRAGFAPGPDHALYLYGGSDGANDFDDVWRWDGTNWTELAPAPTRRSGHGMAYDAARGQIVVTGGSTTTASYFDTWTFDGTTWVDMTGTSPFVELRVDLALAYDPLRRVVVLFSGTNNAETWTWDGSVWTLATSLDRPSPRQKMAFAWNAAHRALVMFGGEALLADLNDTWEWNGSKWVESVIDLAPTPRRGAVATQSRDGLGIVVLGGRTYDIEAPPAQHGWRLHSDGLAPYEACATDIDADGDHLAGCNDPDCWSRCTPFCPPGATACSPAPQCGDGTCNGALETCRLCPGDCGACPTTCGDFACDAGEVCPGDCP